MEGGRFGWAPFDGGRTIGQLGLEQGIIVRDDEHLDGARITLERNALRSARGPVLWVITCGIYGWMVHTRFLDADDPLRAYDAMRDDLVAVLSLIPDSTATDDENDRSIDVVGDALSELVDRYP